MHQFIYDFNFCYELGETAHEPEPLRCDGMNIFQDDDFFVTVDADDKPTLLEPYIISQTRRNKPDSRININEREEVMSVSPSLGWLGIAASPLCSLYTSLSQQKIVHCHVSTLLSQHPAIGTLKKRTFLSC